MNASLPCIQIASQYFTDESQNVSHLEEYWQDNMNDIILFIK